MARPQGEALRRIAEAERAELERLSRSSSERADRVRRATALLAVAEGQSFVAAARRSGLGGSTVTALVRRFNRRGLGALTIATGRGRRPTYDAAARATVVATAQRAPDRRQDGTAAWSLSTLERTVRREGLPEIGATTIRRVLHAAGSSYQRSRTWCRVPACGCGTTGGLIMIGIARPGTRVRVWDGGAPAQERPGHGGRSFDRAKKGGNERSEGVERAYREAEGAGLALLCQDEAGPYQAIPQPGSSWRPETRPARQPHEYLRGGTAKLLTLFRPATGALRAKAVTSGTNAVLHPWLMAELEQVLAGLPAVETAEAERPVLAQWQAWLGHAPITSLPPLRAILIWDNLAGHLSWSIVRWLFQHGVMPLYTPLSGSWLNMAESLQRIVCGRALAGQHPQSQEELITWLEDAVAGWNAAPTPFAWGGKRQERRQRARLRRLGGSGAVEALSQSNAA